MSDKDDFVLTALTFAHGRSGGEKTQEYFEKAIAIQKAQARVNEMARRFEQEVRNVAGESFLNWRAQLQGHCEDFRIELAALDEVKK